MKKFVLITVGFEKPTPEIMKEWMAWFQSIGDRIVDQIGLMNGTEVTKEGMKDLEMDKNALTGYLVIKAENKEEAIEIAKKCPMISSTLVYEAMEQKM